MDGQGSCEYSRPPEIPDLLELCRHLNEHEVKYLLIEDLKIPIPSKRMLIRTKETYRPHDHDDVVFLKALIIKEGKNLETSLYVRPAWRRFFRKFFP